MFPFKTKDKLHPAIFKIRLKQDIDTSVLIDQLAMLSGKQKDMLKVMDAPKKFMIPGITDPVFMKLLNEGTTTYTLMLLHNKTSDDPRPLDIINIMDEQKWLIEVEYPQVD